MENGLIIVQIHLIMPSKDKKPKKEIAKEEERVPKHVNIRLSYRDYLKLLDIADVAGKIKEDKDLKRMLTKVIGGIHEDVTSDKFLGLVAGLPAKEKTLEKFYSQPPRAAPTKMYFTDPEKCSKEVHELYEASKKWTKGRLRYDQSKETCPTDVRVMFYAYVREKGLVSDDNPDITPDKLLKKLAPKTLSGVKHVKRNNGSLIWQICSEIRGIKKADTEVKRRGKKVESSEEEESEEEEPKRRTKKFADVTDISSEEESEEEAPKKNKSKRR
jgi:hypothetical protein